MNGRRQKGDSRGAQLCHPQCKKDAARAKKCSPREPSRGIEAKKITGRKRLFCNEFDSPRVGANASPARNRAKRGAVCKQRNRRPVSPPGSRKDTQQS
jgi:hypothetical protein